MTRRLVVTAVLLVGLLTSAVAAAQTPPLAATLSFQSSPPFGATSPIKINLLLTNATGSPLVTIPGFSQTEFWRNLYFDLEGVGTITDANASLAHSFVEFGTCHYRKNQVLPGAGIQVTPVEVLPGNFAVQFNFDDVRTHFDLSRPGQYTVNARIAFTGYDPGAIINDCNIEFGSQSLLSVGDSATVGRQQFSIVSNSLTFTVETTAPTTTVVATPGPNAAGWNNQNVTLSFTATDNSGGSGVNHIDVSLSGAQTGAQTIPGGSGTVGVTNQGVTTVTYSAVDNANNPEAAKSLTVRIDKTAPVVTAPASITVVATESGGARGSASSVLAAFLAGGSAVDTLDPAPVRLSAQVGGVNVDNNTLFSIGTNQVTFRFQDRAGNIGTSTASVTVTTATTGTPVITVAIAARGVQVGRIFYYDLSFTNTGTGVAQGVTLQQVTFKTLSGTGAVAYNIDKSLKLPVALGNITIGASTTLRVYLTVPPTVKQFSMTESGQLKNSAGATLSFSSTQTVTP